MSRTPPNPSRMPEVFADNAQGRFPAKVYSAMRMRLPAAGLQDTPHTMTKQKPGKRTTRTIRRNLFNTEKLDSKNQVSTLKVTSNLNSCLSRVSTARSKSTNSAEDKAVNMYNRLRKNYPILHSPELNRCNLQSPASVGSNRPTTPLSIRLQKQCLLLFDSPMK